MKRTAMHRISWTTTTTNPVLLMLGGTSHDSNTGCHAIATFEPGGLHVSVSHPNRYPTWDELASARDVLAGPDRRMVMHFPPRSEYVNLHHTTLHLWETP